MKSITSSLKTKDLIGITNIKTKVLLFIFLFLLIGILPVIFSHQLITGPFVNATLLIAAFFIGPVEAIILGLIPSTIALSVGLLPLPMAPMVPFIMMSNALFICIFFLLHEWNFWGAAFISALLKFIFLASVVNLLIPNMVNNEVSSKLSIMMSYPQLYTALIGAIMAFGVIKLVNYSRK